MSKLFRLMCAGLFLLPAFPMFAQRAFTPDDLVNWERITQKDISSDGKWAAVKVAPWQGDARLEVYTTAGKKSVTYDAVGKYGFSGSSRYLVVEQLPKTEVVDSLNLKKVKKKMMPMNMLVVHDLDKCTEWHIDSLKSYKLAEGSDWVAYQQGRKDSVLYVASLDGMRRLVFPNVSSYGFSEEGTSLYFVTADTVDGICPGVYRWQEDLEKPLLVKAGKGKFSRCIFDKEGRQLAFLYAEDKALSGKNSTLWLADALQPAEEVVTASTAGVPSGWGISPDGILSFSADGKRLFLGTAPEPLEKDTTVLDKYRPDVQVWSWDEPVQYTVQQYNLKRDLKRTYRALYQVDEQKLIQLGDTLQPQVVLAPEGVGEWALVSTSRPYSVSSMWEGRTRYDYYKVSLADGEKTLVSQADYTRYRLSPAGKYAFGYCEPDSCWYVIDLSANVRYEVTAGLKYPVWDEENDVPDYPAPYGMVGWTEGDERLLVSDRYDIWSLDPVGKGQPINLTRNGRSEGLRYDWIKLDKEAEAIRTSDVQLLTGFDEKKKTTAFYVTDFTASADPKLVLGGDCRLGQVVKATDSSRLLYTKESFRIYPDVWSAALDFKKPVQLTRGILQQDEYLWGSVELVSWISFDGQPLEGLLFKPEGFDPSKKYPMIVNFYERDSENLHQYHMPQAHRSTIDYHLYLSNGYLVFNPDIRYRDGYPGESCFNCLMSGIASIEAKGFVDGSHIGAQGHSWGGYQVAYLATRTSKFAAIESGAPVVNMFSAYGGIRWGSGLNRSFQYEHTQSRLGATPWDGPVRYFENSPLFLLDKVTTPILIMHNDRDGHVPWYQGIEFFVGMKRLQKPAWLLNYTGEVHWPQRLANQLDFQKRMFQFFNHYLKGEPMPVWMKDGVPAVKQPYMLGY